MQHGYDYNTQTQHNKISIPFYIIFSLAHHVDDAQMIALPPQIYYSFLEHSTLLMDNMGRYMITQKTQANAVQRKIIDRANNPLDTLYKICGIIIITVIKVRNLLASSLQ